MGVGIIGGSVFKTDGEGNIIEPIVAAKESYAINGKEILNYDAKTGILQLNLPEGELEKMIKSIGKIPDKGKNICISVPPFGEEHYFYNVKRIVKISPVASQLDPMKEIKPEKKEGFLSKIYHNFFGK